MINLDIGGPVGVDPLTGNLTTLDETTIDRQNLSFDGTTLSIDNGNSVNLSPLLSPVVTFGNMVWIRPGFFNMGSPD